MTEHDERQRLRAENAALREEIATLRGLVAAAQQALAAEQGRIAQLEATVVRLQAERDQATKPPPFVKKNTPPPPADRPPRTTRAAAQNKARRRAEPTQLIYHEFDHCAVCRYRLRGGHEVWRRQIIELPEPRPVEVIEHRIMTRHCPCCQQWRTPKVAFGGQVVGKGRLGVRLLSVLVFMREVPPAAAHHRAVPADFPWAHSGARAWSR